MLRTVSFSLSVGLITLLCQFEATRATREPGSQHPFSPYDFSPDAVRTRLNIILKGAIPDTITQSVVVAGSTVVMADEDGMRGR